MGSSKSCQKVISPCSTWLLHNLQSTFNLTTVQNRYKNTATLTCTLTCGSATADSAALATTEQAAALDAAPVMHVHTWSSAVSEALAQAEQLGFVTLNPVVVVHVHTRSQKRHTV